MPSAAQGVQITGSGQIADDTVLKQHIAADQVEASEIAANSVGDSEIAAHTTTKITVPVAQVSGELPVSKGGTGQSTADEGFDALAPTSAHGDIIYRGASDNERLAPGTAGLFLKTNGPNAAPEWADASGTAARVLIPRPVAASVGITNASVTGNTAMRVYKFVMPRAMVVNNISIFVNASAANGTVKLAIYSDDGQTKHIEVTTASIGAPGVVTTAVAAITLPAGTYYFAALAQSSANHTLDGWEDSAGDLTLVTSEDSLAGTITVSANTIPSTMSPTFAGGSVQMPLFRLDN